MSRAPKHVSPVWKIRSAGVEDASLIARQRYFRMHEDHRDIADYVAWVSAKIATGTYIGMIADVGCASIAGAGLVLLDWGPTRGDGNPVRGRLVDVFTDPDWRGRGVARSLVENLIETCRKLGVRQVGLSAPAESRALYIALGFVGRESEMILPDRNPLRDEPRDFGTAGGTGTDGGAIAP